MLSPVGATAPLVLVGALLLPLITPRIAAAAAARLRWLPPSGAADTVTGYRVYARSAGTAYGAGAPIWSGNPARGGDGTLSAIVSYAPAPSGTNYFAVTALRDGEESGISQEGFVGAANPCRVDTCVTKTSCSFAALPDGSACDDELFCNGAEICRNGACVSSGPRNCADAFACTVDACDEAADRCTHTGPPGCCVACDTTDPCLADACAAGDCTAPAGIPMQFSVVKFQTGAQGVKLVAKGRFRLSGPLDPATTGATVEMRTADGALAYASTISPELMRAGAAKGRYRYAASRAAAAFWSHGIERLDIRMKGDRGLVTIMGSSDDLAAAAAESTLTVALRFSAAQCLRDMDVPCRQKNSLSICRR
ncbi:MAG: hypothetical protein B6D46_05655 [Polyangiaceae bacterium UTPRO1]|jgi:hypothetical protein|nr:hypothetical protein [Myxococcales bacterium]OQY67507.1 MAG: hypothetical protein B6D46_05655 [Polyangiaceae bacterium UTPRO1]